MKREVKRIMKTALVMNAYEDSVVEVEQSDADVEDNVDQDTKSSKPPHDVGESGYSSEKLANEDSAIDSPLLNGDSMLTSPASPQALSIETPGGATGVAPLSPSSASSEMNVECAGGPVSPGDSSDRPVSRLEFHHATDLLASNFSRLSLGSSACRALVPAPPPPPLPQAGSIIPLEWQNGHVQDEDEEDEEELSKSSGSSSSGSSVGGASDSSWSHTLAQRYQCEEGDTSVQSCLSQFTAVELMTGNNKVGCENCTQRINQEDIFMTRDLTEDRLNYNLNNLNLHSQLKFTWTFSKSHTIFLDGELVLDSGKSETAIYIKPTNHKGLATRGNCIFFTQTNVNKQCDTIRIAKAFLNRSYSRSLQLGHPLVVPYHEGMDTKFWPYHHSLKTCSPNYMGTYEHGFTVLRLVFKRPSNVQNKLVHSKLQPSAIAYVVTLVLCTNPPSPLTAGSPTRFILSRAATTEQQKILSATVRSLVAAHAASRNQNFDSCHKVVRALPPSNNSAELQHWELAHQDIT
ncbi:hypothetical protein PR048_006628 [Dryococelus australis]|uniref:Uncharacterized protein n=1 Tax=Dryococelus australis TaxID=614101 RepID=A0ABQ9IBG9_9NEOP|nr:hypothetical protein PR048_006628 [Dryococelus australis]